MKPSVYTRPSGRPNVLAPRRREYIELPEIQLLASPEVPASTECHITPADVADRMVDYLGPVGDYLTLEPSAGTGSLVAALLRLGHSPRELIAIEFHRDLCTTLGGLGVTVMCRDFLEWAAEVRDKVEIPRVIMNPPFRTARAHVNAALSLLHHAGHEEPPRLVALVPATFDHPQAELMEELPAGTFATAPSVRSKIIRIQGGRDDA